MLEQSRGWYLQVQEDAKMGGGERRGREEGRGEEGEGTR